jgi:hypothetical protein
MQALGECHPRKDSSFGLVHQLQLSLPTRQTHLTHAL